jgi:hypothetical protein
MNSAAQLVSYSLQRASAAGWKFPQNGWRRRRTKVRVNPEQEMAPRGMKEINPCA